MISETTLEDLAKAKGKDRYLKHQERLTSNIGYAETDGARDLIKTNLVVLSGLIETRASQEAFGEQLSAIGYDKAALVALACCFQGVSLVSHLSKVMSQIGGMIEAECWAAGLLKHDEKKAKQIERKVRGKHGNVKYRKQAARSLAARGGYTVDGWPLELKHKIGSFLVNAVLEACGNVFLLDKVDMKVRRAGKDYNRESYVITLTEEAKARIDEVSAAMCELTPMLLPMTEAPDPWTALVGGGYKDKAIKKLTPLVRVRYGNKEHKALLVHAIKSGQMQPVLDAVNAIQSTRFKINTRILGLIQWVRAEGIEIDGLPRLTDFPAPDYPEDWDNLADEDKRKWKRKGAKIATKNLGLVGERSVFSNDMETASLLADAPYFCVPHFLDFRGRIYGMSSFNFQRGDHVRAMFLFADGKPIGDEGLKWLAIHLANVGDFNKVSKAPMADRIAWVNDNLDVILEVAQDPRGTVDWWSQADCPFLFVAACMEYAEALVHGPEYVSHLPVSWDGSCSGIQHLTAMMKSPEGAYVNLTPNDQPQDVYKMVADRVSLRLPDEAARGNSFAQAWIDYGFGRSEAKRGVMTYAYSSRAFGMAEQIRQDLMEPLSEKVLEGKINAHPFGQEEGFKDAAYMGKLLCDTIEDFIRAPAQGMDFLRRVAQGLAHEGKSPTWVTPAGLPVVSWYPENDTGVVRLYLYDRGINVSTQLRMDKGPTKTINKDKSMNSIAPNFVHSMDACHLMMVVNAAKAEGIAQQALVHDSFGCLAADAERYNQVIREQFVRLYDEHDVLADMRASALEQITAANAHRIPEVPHKGDLDLKEVLRSDYAFA